METFSARAACFGCGGEFGVLRDALVDGRAEHPQGFEDCARVP
jgi:hypothetical protein